MFFFAFLGFFVCCGYTTGSDWRAYEPMYQQISSGELPLFVFMTNIEPGYVIYNYLCGLLGINFWHFFIITKIILYIIIIRHIKMLCPANYVYVALMFFISWYLYFLFIDNPMRNLIAVSIFLLSLKSLIDNKLGVYMGYTVVAMCFHTTALIMPILYWIAHKRIHTHTIITLYILLNIILISDDIIYAVLNTLFSWIPIVGDKIAVYSSGDIADGQGKLFSLGMIIHNIFFILIIQSRKCIENIKNGNIIFIFSILFLIFYRMGLSITILGRLQLYLAVFYCISIAVTLKHINARSKLLYTFYVLIVSVIPCISYLSKTTKYLPYTNYFFMPEMSYEDRDIYNKINFPYHYE